VRTLFNPKSSKQLPVPEVRRERGVPQGGVLSGLLSNLYLSGFDRAVLNLFKGYVRYADDFVICCESAESCTEAGKLVTQQLGDLKLSLNTEKTDPCRHAERGVDFLGFRISHRAQE